MSIKKHVHLLFSIIVLSCLLILFTGCKEKTTQKWVGITLASKLNCRKKPNLKSKVIASYNFGTPILLTKKTKHKTKVGKLNNFWYQDAKSKGWLYAGFLKIVKHDPKRTGSISAEIIRCNIVGGGSTFFHTFQPILINDYFIAAIPLTDYPINENNPFMGIVIGKFKKTAKQLIFYKGLYFGAYNSKRHWINNHALVKNSFQQQKLYYLLTLNKKTDQDGEYYINSREKKNITRNKARSKCANKKFKKPLWVNIHTYIAQPISSLDAPPTIPFF